MTKIEIICLPLFFSFFLSLCVRVFFAHVCIYRDRPLYISQARTDRNEVCLQVLIDISVRMSAFARVSLFSLLSFSFPLRSEPEA